MPSYPSGQRSNIERPGKISPFVRRFDIGHWISYIGIYSAFVEEELVSSLLKGSKSNERPKQCVISLEIVKATASVL